jgi:hypothetical protein
MNTPRAVISYSIAKKKARSRDRAWKTVR